MIFCGTSIVKLSSPGMRTGTDLHRSQALIEQLFGTPGKKLIPRHWLIRKDISRRLYSKNLHKFFAQSTPTRVTFIMVSPLKFLD